MLMRCEGCGRIFNYEKADGVCPNCGQFCEPSPWARKAGARLPEMLGTLRGGAPETPCPEAAFAAAGNAVLRDSWRAAFFVLVLFWACVMAGGFLLLRHQQSALPERAAFLSPVADEVNGAFRRHGREIAVTGAEVMGSEYRAGLPQGGCLVRVGLRLDETSWYGNSDEFYLQSGGCFYKSTDSCYLAQLYPEIAENALDGIQPQYTSAAEGWLYFALPGPPEDAALYLEQADGYGSDRRVRGAAFCPLAFTQAGTEGGEADG